jgi:hypothetical protein
VAARRRPARSLQWIGLEAKRCHVAFIVCI